jgi:hypothetical protein
MKLRDHPLISYRDVHSWPPTWLWRGGKKHTRPHGEVGILKEVILTSIEPCSMCFLIMECEGGEYMGILRFEDSGLCREIYRVLLRHCGRPIQEIGEIDLSHTL